MYASDKAALQAEESEQSAMSARLRAASAAFSAARASGDDETGRARRAALQRLARAHTAYREVASHLDAGRRFYNDLARMATAFRDRCREFALRRRDEAARLERCVSTLFLAPGRRLTGGSDFAAPDVSKLSLGTASSLQRQKAADGQQNRQQQQPTAGPKPPPEALVAPLPSRPAAAPPAAVMWSPDVGIRFGADAPAAAAPTAQAGAGMEAPAGKAKAQWSPGKGIRFN
jgi:programmed cell death 6-interacting protein